MATYKAIQEYVKDKYNTNIKTCWIAHVKEQCGLPLSKASNRIDDKKRKYPCPDDKEVMIIDAFKHFNML